MEAAERAGLTRAPPAARPAGVAALPAAFAEVVQVNDELYGGVAVPAGSLHDDEFVDRQDRPRWSQRNTKLHAREA